MTDIKPFAFGFFGLFFMFLLWQAMKPSTGGFNESCNRDGTCNNVNLICDVRDGRAACLNRVSYNAISENQSDSKSQEKETFQPKAKASSEEYHGVYESEKFCINCQRLCKDTGMAECNFSDTTTWGNKTPATCKCK